MDKKTLLEILNSDSMEFTLAEIQEIVDEELAKNPEEMDTELIDLCANVIGEACADENAADAPKKKKIIKLNRTLLIAAILILLVGVTIPVSARFTFNDVSDKIVEFYSDCFKVNLRNGQTEAEHYSDKDNGLLKELKDKGVDNVILPSALLEQNYENEVSVLENDNCISATIKFEDKDSKINCIVAVDQYYDEDDVYDFMIGQTNLPTKYENMKQLSINGLDVIVCEKSDATYIKYVDEAKEYSIALLDCSFEKTEEIANTLK